MSDFAGLRKLNPGLPKVFVNADEAQDWLPFGADEETILAKAKQQPSVYLEWAHWYNAWEDKGRDV